MALEENDESLLPELTEDFDKFAEKLESVRLSTLLTGFTSGKFYIIIVIFK